MTIDWTKVAAAVESAADLVEELAPLAAPANPGVAALVSQGAAFVASAAQAATDVSATISGGDAATIAAADQKVRAINIGLAQQIAGS